MLEKRTAPKRVRIETFKNLTEDHLRPCTDDELKVWLAGINKLQKTDSKVDACKIFIEHELKTRESKRWTEDLQQQNKAAREEVIEVSEDNTDTSISKEEPIKVLSKDEAMKPAAPKAEMKVIHGIPTKVSKKKGTKLTEAEKKSNELKKQIKEKAKKASGKPGIVSEIAKCIKDAGKKGITKADILEHLIKEFPNREPEKMKATVTVQVPGRISKERFLVEKFDDNKYRAVKTKK